MAADPMQEAAARIRAAGDQFGAAIGDAVKVAFRRAIATQLTEDLGEGPWLLYPDGRVERYADQVGEDPEPPGVRDS